jgi:hypothetical protein
MSRSFKALTLTGLALILTLAILSSPKPSILVAAAEQSTPSATFQATTTSTSIDVNAVNAKVAEMLNAGSIQEYALCNLDAAVWGGYDVTLTVGSGYTKNSSAHVFKISQGVFSDEVGSANPGAPATVEGRGIVKIDDQTTAFERGVPFFITDVTFDGTSKLSFTVVSNPKVSVEYVSAGVESISDTFYSATIDTPHSFSSSSEPQHLTFELGNQKPGKGSYLSILKPISGTYSTCLKSNQVELGALVPSGSSTTAATEASTAAATPGSTQSAVTASPGVPVATEAPTATGGTVKGTIVGEGDGQPVADLDVALYEGRKSDSTVNLLPPKDRIRMTGKTDAQGHYVFQNVPVGLYGLTFSKTIPNLGTCALTVSFFTYFSVQVDQVQTLDFEFPSAESFGRVEKGWLNMRKKNFYGCRASYSLSENR